MKKIAILTALIISFSILAQTSSFAQQTRRPIVKETSFKVVDASAVPEVVKSAQEQAFPGTAVTKWEQRSVKTEKKEGSHYVAVFTSAGQKTRARYDATGKSIAVTKPFVAAYAPEVVKSAMSRYSGYTLTSGEESSVTDKGTFYRVRLRQGAKKLVVYLDESGAELTKDKRPELLDEMEEEGQ